MGLCGPAELETEHDPDGQHDNGHDARDRRHQERTSLGALVILIVVAGGPRDGFWLGVNDGRAMHALTYQVVPYGLFAGGNQRSKC